MDSRASKSHDTTFDRLFGLLRAVVGVALFAHAGMVAQHHFRYMETTHFGSSVIAPYLVFGAEVVLGLVVAADFLFRIACTVVGLLLLVVMLIVLVGERLGVSDRARRYPVALFLICLTGIFTGIGEFALLNYLRTVSGKDGSNPRTPATIA